MLGLNVGEMSSGGSDWPDADPEVEIVCARMFEMERLKRSSE
jgi:hypothetical protein